MVEQQVTIIKVPTLDEAIVQKFIASFRGELIRPGDAGYDEARKIWNGMIDRHPARIARYLYLSSPIPVLSGTFGCI